MLTIAKQVGGLRLSMNLVKLAGYDHYYVSDEGYIYSNNKRLASRINKDGYDNVFLYKDGKGKNYKVHRLVAQAFIPNPQNLPEVNHKDHNPSNNKVENLEWCDRTYNNRYSRAKKVKQLTLDGQLIKTWECTRDIERTIKIAHNMVSLCCNGKLKTAGGYKWEYVEMSETSWKDKKGYELC